jgi:hypothetical protein
MLCHWWAWKVENGEKKGFENRAVLSWQRDEYGQGQLVFSPLFFFFSFFFSFSFCFSSFSSSSFLLLPLPVCHTMLPLLQSPHRWSVTLTSGLVTSFTQMPKTTVRLQPAPKKKKGSELQRILDNNVTGKEKDTRRLEICCWISDIREF